MQHESVRVDDVSGTCGHESQRRETDPPEFLSATNESMRHQPEASLLSAAIPTDRSKLAVGQGGV